jgi:alkanesulfonate monooxygenase SsuD/methylene tetrahydromethanopterin reductase-like flavin-dependent oxidoreductase (luciferase family)
MSLRFGVQGSGQLVGGVPPPEHFLDVARLAEALGYDSLWAGDHVSFNEAMAVPPERLAEQIESLAEGVVAVGA